MVMNVNVVKQDNIYALLLSLCWFGSTHFEIENLYATFYMLNDNFHISESSLLYTFMLVF
ncbi:hypothetical protein Patl1_14993 [Pistacia atlantica]|uniref:Uncharacterized protein n=1 Tax=Pistacia atlantica TaxID=434234 RepID=A0ACC1B5W9_9ROSI|nr:hypothetical protein Patl1_14993 [Pistacia atlantica]